MSPDAPFIYQGDGVWSAEVLIQGPELSWHWPTSVKGTFRVEDVPMSPRGGKREGAGPKPLFAEKMVRISVHLTAEQKEKARRIGDDDMAAGVRRALDSYKED